MKSRLFILNLITSIILVSFNIAETVVVQRSQNCIKKTKVSNQNFNDDVEEARDILQLQSRSVGAKRWRGKKVLYKIENMPECSDGLTVADVSKIIDAAAGEWNSIPRANVLLINVDALSEEEKKSDPTINIRVSFLPCEHKDPTLKLDLDFIPCGGQFGHAIHFGDIHLNSFMTWTNKDNLQEKYITESEFVMPNLYAIVLHEFGHSLGLSHSQFPEQVMFAHYGGDRKHTIQKLGTEDMQKMQELYQPEQSCRDKSVFCQSRGTSVCKGAEQRAACPNTCGDCKCDPNTPDEYLKCTPSICSGSFDLKLLCKNTCKLCEKTCSSLPVIRKITSSAVFPVSAGTLITVGCQRGSVLTGDTAVTCVSENEYSYETEPRCVEEEEEEPEELAKCKNKSKKCAKKLKNGKKCKSKWMKANCKKTCNQCPAT